MFVIKTKNPKIIRAAEIANEFWDTQLDVILKETYFTYTNQTVKTIHSTLGFGARSSEIIVELYAPLWPWSRAIARSVEPNKIQINRTKLANRDVFDYVNTIVHECTHFKSFGNYQHGDNYPKGKENSVPYRVGQIAEDFARFKYEKNKIRI